MKTQDIFNLFSDFFEKILVESEMFDLIYYVEKNNFKIFKYYITKELDIQATENQIEFAFNRIKEIYGE